MAVVSQDRFTVAVTEAREAWFVCVGLGGGGGADM